MHYHAAIEPDTDTEAFGVIVPDLPGCFSAGDTLEEAMAMTEDAIVTWIESAIHAGQDLPLPSDVDTLRGAHKEWNEWIWAVVKVDTSTLSGCQGIAVNKKSRSHQE